MLNGISKILTGDILKILCDMGHGDVLVISDGNFSMAEVPEKVYECTGVNSSEVLSAILPLFPLDYGYTEYPISVMELTEGDVKRGMPRPEAWADFEKITREYYPEAELGMIERYDFYHKCAKSYALIKTGEERQYGNIMLVKGCVL